MNFFERYHLRKAGKRLIREIRHAAAMREDIAGEKDMAALRDIEADARRAVEKCDSPAYEKAANRADEIFKRLFPPRPFGALRENFEIVVVALIVAMGFRTYFIQPYKIPTSSMSPTLRGIHYLPASGPRFFDRFPLKIGRWLLFGEWYTEVRARASGGVMAPPVEDGVFAADGAAMVSGVPHPVYKGMFAYCKTGDFVFDGRPLASGLRVNGDHIFVNRLIWNYRSPRRGEVMVFRTHGINHPDIKPNEHYVKRMVGMPGERISIAPPYIKVNGSRISQPPGIARIEECAPGYHGYRLADKTGARIGSVDDEEALGPDEYFACGDNQRNSADSRYWGPVPHRNLIGPAFFLYWPFSRNWGLIR